MLLEVVITNGNGKKKCVGKNQYDPCGEVCEVIIMVIAILR